MLEGKDPYLNTDVGTMSPFEHGDNAIGPFQSHGSHITLDFQNGIMSSSAAMVSKGFGIGSILLRRGICCSGRLRLCMVHGSSSHYPIADPVQFLSNNGTTDSRKNSNKIALILIRHEESLWNEKNLFTGCVDVPRTEKRVYEAIEAAKKISNIPVDGIYICTDMCPNDCCACHDPASL